MTLAEWISMAAVIVPAVTSIVIGAITIAKVQTVHLLVNSRMDKWLEEAKALAHFEGAAEGREEMAEDVARKIEAARSREPL